MTFSRISRRVFRNFGAQTPTGQPRRNQHPRPGLVRHRCIDAKVETMTSPRQFLAASRGGHFKGRDPSAAPKELAEAWMSGAEVIYIGNAGAGRAGRRGLMKRLEEYRSYGEGRPVGPGGRYICSLQTRTTCLSRGS